MKYVNVVVSNKSDKTDQFYTYGCDFDDVKIGNKVYVPFNRGNARKEAYVFDVTDEPEKPVKGLKYVDEIDDDIFLTEEMIDTCRWMKSRYLCRYIDAVGCFVPAGKASARGIKRKPYEDAVGEAHNIETLTNEQEKALIPLRAAIKENRRELFLLHGVTGSGKTEIFIQSVAEAMNAGRTAIMMVPEISLTKQIIDRFIGRFGAENIAVLHSRLSPGERYDEWIRIRNGEVKVVIGARSAVFAPLENIGVIIMDEEHESTYKSDQTPKYETVEVAIKRITLSQGILILGSATPSVVSFSRADEKIYKKLELTKRYNDVGLPDVEIADMRHELKKGNLTIFSGALYKEIKRVLAEGEKVILFLNRRGYSNFITCRECGEAIRCPVCGISLTYHKGAEKLVCHYCGHAEAVPGACPSCGSKYIKYIGIGTEQVEEAVKEMFPVANAARLDFDTIRHKGSMEKVLSRFAKGKKDILIGTQLVAKGLDFKDVGLVGIISADVTLNIPDFRAAERTFQLITQASGRAGRGDRKGKVIIQAYAPDNYAVRFAANYDFEGFYEKEIAMRRMMNYPPFSDLVQLVFSSKDQDAARAGGELWRKEILILLGGSDKNVFPLQAAPINRIKDTYRYSMLIKSLKGKRALFAEVLRQVKEKHIYDRNKKYNVAIDYNPYSFL